MTVVAGAWFLDSPGRPLARRDLAIGEPAPGEAIVEVLACGLCHTDLGYAGGAVPPRRALPLVLGHEVVGTVAAAGERFAHLAGRRVIVPAVLPCGDCAFCRAGRSNACPAQKMPGNDVHGGFATHLLLPAAPLVSVDDVPPPVDPRDLAVVADAVSTAYRAVRRAGFEAGDAAVVVGAGGVGGFVVQIARALGGQVVALDVSPARLAAAAAQGAEVVIDARGRDPRDVRRDVHGRLKAREVPSLRWRIFECSGTTAGQELAFGLLARAATLVQVGYAADPLAVRWSNLMAFDATVHGTWGCPPEAYPEVLAMIARGDVALAPFVEHAPMSELNDLLAAMAAGRLEKRMVLDPRA